MLARASDDRVADLLRRQLYVRGAPVPLGGRAFDILEILVQSDGKLVTKDDLIGRVWSGAIVEDNVLQVHVSAIRKALGADRGLLKTESGRGYRLLGNWAIREKSAPDPATLPEPLRTNRFLTNVPALASALIGRKTVLQHLQDLLAAYRVVTLTGPGGIGKSALALAVARNLFPTFEGDIWLVELASLSDPTLMPSTVASVLGPKLGNDTPAPDSVARLIGERKTLLVLDNCEHLIDASATLAETLVHMCPRTFVLATSREILRIEGEYVHRVPPLEVPPEDQEEPGQILGYSAAQLLVARMEQLSSESLPEQGDVPTVAAICRHLDGIPLALEFAAARAATLGLRQVAAHLNNRFGLLTTGRRTALPRHQTLRATLDWSYELLPESERRLLRRLAAFSGVFTLEAATAIMRTESAASAVAEGVANLVAKSLVTLDRSAPSRHWRLLETIRAYALEKLAESGEAEQVALLHACYFRDLFTRARTEWDQRTTAEWLAVYAGQIDNVRAALDWSNSANGDATIAISLTTAAVPLWFEMWLLEECRARAEQALTILESSRGRDDRRRMQLYVAVALSQAYTLRTVRDTQEAWAAALEIAQALDDAEYQLRALWGIWGTHVNRGEFKEGLAIAKQFSDLASKRSDANDRLVGDRLTGAALHFLGDQLGAREHIERMLTAYVTPIRRSHAVRFQSDQRVTGHMYLARVLWLQGHPDQAARIAEANVADARLTNHPLSLCNALAGAACPIALLTGDLAAAERYTKTLLDQTTREVLEIWGAHGVCFEGEILVKRGNVAAGSLRLRAGTDQLIQSKFDQYLPALLGALAQAFAAAGQVSQAHAMIDEAIARSERSHGLWCLAELLRIKGLVISLADSAEHQDAAEGHFFKSLRVAEQQGALAWQLRTATSLALLRRGQGRITEGLKLLRGVWRQFKEGHGTADLRVAKGLLDELQTEIGG